MDMAEQNRLPTDVDAQPVVQAAVLMQSELRQYQKEIEQEQRFPQTLVDRMKEAGFYRLMIPHSLGGLHADPLTYLRVEAYWEKAIQGAIILVALVSDVALGRLERHARINPIGSNA